MKTSLDSGGAGPRTGCASSSRRRLLAALAGAGAGLLLGALGPGAAAAFSTYRKEPRDVIRRFALAQLRHGGADWNPRPGAAPEFLRELERMTSVEPIPEPLALGVGDPGLFTQPFLCLGGQRDFPPFTPEEVVRLRTWLEAGGTLLVDDAAATPGYGFDAAARRELARVLPGAPLARLGPDHTIFKSFFLVRTVSGARIASPFLEGINVQGRTAVVYSSNDLFGAYARDPLGRWADPCAPGGERQRRLAFHLGVNIVLYALCSDYKQDRIHLPFLRLKS